MHKGASDQKGSTVLAKSRKKSKRGKGKERKDTNGSQPDQDGQAAKPKRRRRKKKPLALDTSTEEEDGVDRHVVVPRGRKRRKFERSLQDDMPKEARANSDEKERSRVRAGRSIKSRAADAETSSVQPAVS